MEFRRPEQRRLHGTALARRQSCIIRALRGRFPVRRVQVLLHVTHSNLKARFMELRLDRHMTIER